MQNAAGGYPFAAFFFCAGIRKTRINVIAESSVLMRVN